MTLIYRSTPSSQLHSLNTPPHYQRNVTDSMGRLVSSARSDQMSAPRPMDIPLAYLQFGGLKVAFLLARIVFCHEHADSGEHIQVYRHGQTWIVKTGEQWRNESGLTAKEYRRAISILKTKRLIELKIMKHQGNPVSHVRLLPDNLKDALAMP